MKLIDIPKVLFWTFSEPDSTQSLTVNRPEFVAPFKDADPLWLVYEDDRPHPSDVLRRGFHVPNNAYLYIMNHQEKCNSKDERYQALNIHVGHTGSYQYGGITYIPGQKGFDSLDPRDRHWPMLLKLLTKWHELCSASEDYGSFRYLSEHEAEMTILQSTKH